MKIKKTYQGAIPLNRIANEYNQSEINTYSTNYINDQLDATSNLITQTNDKFNNYATKEEIKRNYIMVTKSNDSAKEPIKWSTSGEWARLPLAIIASQSGISFKLDEYGSAVAVEDFSGPVLITAAITYDCRVAGDGTYLFGSIRKNGTNIVKTISHSSGNWHTLHLSTVLYVQDGDVIDLAVYKDSTEEFSFYNYTGFTNAPCCYMTVTEI